MGEFCCYLCFVHFDDSKLACDHLRKEHKIKEKVNSLRCIVDPNCPKTFQTFNGLKKHIKKCHVSVNECIENELTNSFIENNWLREDTGASTSISNAITIEYDGEEIESLPEIIDCKVGEERLGYVRNFAISIENLAIPQKVKDHIFDLTKELLEKTCNFNNASIKENIEVYDDNILEVLSVAHNEVVNEISNYDTVYKRNKFHAENQLYVKPEERAIGTHWETKRNRVTKKKYPVHVQSEVQFIPITKTLESLFRRETVKKLYFTYNAESNGTKHTCAADKYIDFCCGRIHKNNSLFISHPESLQIQIFNDGFEICDAVKSKSNVHSQVAFYFAIRNMPAEHAFNLDNIYLVALCNANDLRSQQTDYNNIWRMIVDDLAVLETTGINIGSENKLKGNYLSLFFLLRGV